MERKTGSFKNIWKAAVSGILFAVSVALVFCDQTAKADEEYVSWKLESGESIDAAKDDYVITHTDQMSEEDASLYKKKYVLKNLHGETVLDQGYNRLSFVQDVPEENLLYAGYADSFLYSYEEATGKAYQGVDHIGVIAVDGTPVIDVRYGYIEVKKGQYFFCYDRDNDDYAVDVYRLDGTFVSTIFVNTENAVGYGRYQDFCDDLYSVEKSDGEGTRSTVIVDLYGNILEEYDSLEFIDSSNASYNQGSYYYKVLKDSEWYLYKYSGNGELLKIYNGYWNLYEWTANGYVEIYDEDLAKNQLINLETGETWSSPDGRNIFEAIYFIGDRIWIQNDENSEEMDVYDENLNFLEHYDDVVEINNSFMARGEKGNLTLTVPETGQLIAQHVLMTGYEGSIYNERGVYLLVDQDYMLHFYLEGGTQIFPSGTLAYVDMDTQTIQIDGKTWNEAEDSDSLFGSSKGAVIVTEDGWVCVFFCEDTQNSVDKSSYEVTIPYEDQMLKAAYDERWFEKSSYEYNHELAKLSLCLEMSSFTKDALENWGESGEEIAAERSENVVKAFRSIGFEEENIKTYHYDKPLNDASDKIAYTIANKKLSSGKTLIAVVCRGGGYGREWSSNFHVYSDENEDESFHAGFYNAMKEVFGNVKTEIEHSDSDVVLWITGYSRGAAVANLLSGRIDDWASIYTNLSADAVFSYCYATPRGVKADRNPEKQLYQNIFNIINPGDAVPEVALQKWGYTRYGATKLFDEKVDTAIASEINSVYQDLTGNEFDVLLSLKQASTVRSIVQRIDKAFPTERSADKVLTVVRDLMAYSNYKVKDIPVNFGSYTVQKENDVKWFEMPADVYFSSLERYGASYREAKKKVSNFLTQNNKEYSIKRLPVSMETIIKKFIPDYYNAIELGLTLCKLNEINLSDIAGLLVELLGPDYHYSEVYGGLFNVANDAVTIGGSHFSEVYYSWMCQDEERAFGYAEAADKKGNTDHETGDEITGSYYFVYNENDAGRDYTARESWYDVQDNQDGSIDCVGYENGVAVESFTASLQSNGRYSYVSNALYEGYVSEYSIDHGVFITYGFDAGNSYYYKDKDFMRNH